MTRLAIIIAVSEYFDTDVVGNLPACSNDAAAMEYILSEGSRYEDILTISGSVQSISTKQRLSEFAHKHRNKEIEEVLFYFTGHGEFEQDEFYYLLSDYSQKKRKQTSLENSELDGIVRPLSPKLFVKIVDACQSGVRYIKSNADFSLYLKNNTKEFEKIYFLFSSQSNQFSYQDSKISDFTGAIVNSILARPDGPLRYKDVISYISDEFDTNDHQTPFFITQADYTEIFCQVNSKLKDHLADFILTSKSNTPRDDKKIQGTDLVSKIKLDAGRYVKKEEAMSQLEFFFDFLSRFDFFGELEKFGRINEIYRVIISKEKSSPPQCSTIGDWLKTSKETPPFFAKPDTDWEEYQKRILPGIYNSLLGGIGSSISNSLGLGSISPSQNPTYITDRREIVVGYEHTTDMPYNYVKISFFPLTANLTPVECYIVAIVSPVKVRCFWTFAILDLSDWSNTQLNQTLSWYTNEVDIKHRHAIEQVGTQICSQFSKFIITNLQFKWGDPEYDHPSSQNTESMDPKEA